MDIYMIRDEILKMLINEMDDQIWKIDAEEEKSEIKVSMVDGFNFVIKCETISPNEPLTRNSINSA